VAGALQNSQVSCKGANKAAILVGQDSGDLVEMSHVVDDPGGEEFRERDRAEGGVAAAQGKLFGIQV
jgi:hypothetical protein